MNRPPFQVIAKPQTRGKGTNGERGNHNGHINRGQHDSYAGEGAYGEHRSYDDHRGQGVYKIQKEHKSYKDRSENKTHDEREHQSVYPHSSKRDWLDEPEDLKAGKPEIEEPLREEDWAEWSPGFQERMVMATLALISLIVALDATILVPVLPTIGLALHGTTTEVFWAATSYLLASAAFQPLLSSLSDVFGQRSTLLCSLLLFTAGTIIAALAQNFTLLLVGRSVQGVGGSGIMALVQVIFTDIVPLRHRGNYLSLIHMTWALGSVLGPIVGGVIVQKTSWRWTFWTRLPLLAAGLAMTAVWVKLDAVTELWGQKLRRVDWVGAGVFIPSITSFLIGVTWGGSNYSWGSWQTVVPIVVGVLGLMVSFVYEKCGARNPFINPVVFSHRSTSAAFAAAFMQGFVLYGVLYYIPFFLESVKGFNAAMSGLGLIPIIFALVPSSAAVGIIMSRTDNYLWPIWVGWAVTVSGSGLLIFLDVEIANFNWILIFLVIGLGQGILLTPINLAAQAACHPRDAAFAAAMFTFMRGLGVCIAVAVGGSVFQNTLSSQLSSAGLNSSMARNATAYVIELSKKPDGPDKSKILHAYGGAFAAVFEVLAGIALLGAVISLLIEPHSTNKESDTAHVLRKTVGKSTNRDDPVPEE
ncbi:MAG: hypothetical protein M1839_002030 [Geoglossum umbratile]|nr:MAG: hypothetical protein M1839_002030 [Geoglossum umbratile]